MHTVNIIKHIDRRLIACVDGYCLCKKNLIVNKIKREIYKIYDQNY